MKYPCVNVKCFNIVTDPNESFCESCKKDSLLFKVFKNLYKLIKSGANVWK